MPLQHHAGRRILRSVALADLEKNGARTKPRAKKEDLSQWPKGTPQPIIDKLNAEVVKILGMPDVKERFAGGGVDTIPSTPAELDARVKQDLERFRVIVQKANIRPD